MALQQSSLADLSDDQLLLEVKRLAAAERRATAALLRALIELDTRRLYRGQGCSSLFTYCTHVLHLEEGAAYNRIEVARAAHRFPVILEVLEEGALTLTSVRLLAPHLTVENHERVLASARHKRKRDVELLVASLNPQPDVASFVRKLPRPRVALEECSANERPPCDGQQAAPASNSALTPTPTVVSPNAPALESVVCVPPTAFPRGARPVVSALAPERYKLQITISKDTHDKLRRVRDLMRHSVPNGDLAEIFDRALTMLFEELERRRAATTSHPRTPRKDAAHSRHIPAAVRREVWKRDEGRCAFVGVEGRCTERGLLEFHHVEPYATGGAATVENVQLRCRTHNAYEATCSSEVRSSAKRDRRRTHPERNNPPGARRADAHSSSSPHPSRAARH